MHISIGPKCPFSTLLFQVLPLLSRPKSSANVSIHASLNILAHVNYCHLGILTPLGTYYSSFHTDALVCCCFLYVCMSHLPYGVWGREAEGLGGGQDRQQSCEIVAFGNDDD